jgi:hypothetical protein
MGFDTGFSEQNFQTFIFDNCNSGMEREQVGDDHHVLKCPYFLRDIEAIVQKIEVEMVIIPIRDYNQTAKSRAGHGPDIAGGFWNGAKSFESQKRSDMSLMAAYMLSMVDHEIPTTFFKFRKNDSK